MNEMILLKIKDFKDKKVLVVGESSVDVELKGVSRRVAREAPVPIVDVERLDRVAGRAANTAANLAQLGAQVTFLSVIGDDLDGNVVKEILGKQGVDISALITCPYWKTQAVQRLTAGDHMLVRFEHGRENKMEAKDEKRFIEALRELQPNFDAILVSDYGHGIMTDKVIAELSRLQRKEQKTLVVDSKYLDRYRRTRPTAVKPNYLEALSLLGLTKIEPPGRRAAQIEKKAKKLLSVTGAATVAVTLDVDGAVVMGKNQTPYRTYSKQIKDSKAVGAGDTYAAALTLALASSATLQMAAEIAQAAALIVARKVGTAACDQEELRSVFTADPKYVTDWRVLVRRLKRLKAQGQRIVFTNGCFDILHSGHVKYLERAKGMGDLLVLGINSDASVARLKGAGRPVNTLLERVRVLSGLQSVDLIVPFPQDTPCELLEEIRPNVYVKGGDYTRETLPETPVIEKHGGRVEIVPFIASRSTTKLINRIYHLYRKSLKEGPPYAGVETVEQ